MLAETARLLGEVKGLQKGYTTGTTAQGACKGAAELLISGIIRDRVEVTLPDGLVLPLFLKECRLEENDQKEKGQGEWRAVCAVEKDPGDDKDITRGMLIFAQAVYVDEPGVFLEGGAGVGRVTRPGLAVKPGESAINPVPRKLMLRDLEALCPPGKGIRVTLTIPRGEELALKTWNPRLGIEGGLSIIGTTGIVEPKSDAAYKASIDVSIDMCHAFNPDFLCITLGYVGEKALALENPPIPMESVIKCGDHVGHTLEYALDKGFKKIYLVGHVGKLIKLALGIFDTHWKSGDGRMEALAAYAGVLGADTDLLQEIMTLELAEEGVALLERRGFDRVFEMTAEKILFQIQKRYGGPHYQVSLVNLEGRILARKEG
jgi:cobalt-precorrin-5B (C1)-methyltransferase